MKRNRFNLNAQLFVNLILVGILLIGLWRGEPVFDATIRLPNILVFLVIINTLIIFRESLKSTTQRFGAADFSYDDLLRQVLNKRECIDQNLLPDALMAVFQQSCGKGMALLKIEEKGFLGSITSTGAISPQFSGAKIFREEGFLKIRHPGGLGDEVLCSWPNPLDSWSFCSSVTQLCLQIVPLSIFGRVQALWINLPKTSLKHPSPNRKSGELKGIHALFLESMLALSLGRSESPCDCRAETDAGLMRFEGFQRAFETEVERSERYQQAMTLMLLSAPGLNNPSDSSCGAVQKAMTAALQDSLRRLDLSFQWRKPGEFAAVLTETNGEVARLVAERIVTAYAKHLSGKTASGQSEKSLAIGYAAYPADATHGDGLLEKAEEAMSFSRNHGGIISFSSILELSNQKQ